MLSIVATVLNIPLVGVRVLLKVSTIHSVLVLNVKLVLVSKLTTSLLMIICLRLLMDDLCNALYEETSLRNDVPLFVTGVRDLNVVTVDLTGVNCVGCFRLGPVLVAINGLPTIADICA